MESQAARVVLEKSQMKTSAPHLNVVGMSGEGAGELELGGGEECGGVSGMMMGERMVTLGQIRRILSGY